MVVRGLGRWAPVAGGLLLAWAAAAEDVKPKIVLQVDHGTSPTAVAWTPDGQYLLTGGPNLHVILWDVARGYVVDNIKIPFDYKGLDLCWYPGHYTIGRIAVSPDGRYAFARTGSGTRFGAQAIQRTAILDLGTRRLIAMLPTEGIAWFPDSRRLLVRKPAVWSRTPSKIEGDSRDCDDLSDKPTRLSAGAAFAYDVAAERLSGPIAEGLADNAPPSLTPDGRFLLSFTSRDMAQRLKSDCDDVRDAQDCRPPGYQGEFTSRWDRIAAERDTIQISAVLGERPSRVVTPDGTQIVGGAFGPDGRRVYVMTKKGFVYRYGVDPADDLAPIDLTPWAAEPDLGPIVGPTGNMLLQFKAFPETPNINRRRSLEGEEVSKPRSNFQILLSPEGREIARSTGQPLAWQGNTAVIYQGFDDDADHAWPSIAMDLSSGKTTPLGPQLHVPAIISRDETRLASIAQIDPKTGAPAPTKNASGQIQIDDLRSGLTQTVLRGGISNFAVDAGVGPDERSIIANLLVVNESYLNYLRDVGEGQDRPVETVNFDIESGRFNTAERATLKLKSSLTYDRKVRSVVSPDGALTARFFNSSNIIRVRDSLGPDTEEWSPEGMNGSVLRLGFMTKRPLIWAAAADGSVGFWSTRDHRLVLTIYLLKGPHFLALAPDGRYDTDLGADAPDVRWLMSDEPYRSLGPQTFMRQYYRPGLVSLVLDCVSHEGRPDCTSQGAAPDLASLNRVLPEVRAIKAAPGPDAQSVRVKVDLADGVYPAAANGKTASGLYDLRLFRDGHLVGEWPDPVAEPGRDATSDWRDRYRLAAPGHKGLVSHTFLVALPSSPPSRPLSFTAYAFNEDRVKSDTARVDYAPAIPPTPRPRRAYIIAIGVNDYRRSPDLNLSFAANDAHDIAAAVKRVIPYGEVIDLPLTAEPGAAQLADKAAIHAVFQILAGAERVDPDGAAALKRGGTPLDKIGKATPDDLVVVAFSGHGWADPGGRFYLLPGDAVRPADAREPDRRTLISSEELADWLKPVDAGEMAVIIDACHSAASVATQAFKPGPMGDSGLGQLAFDKGIRILAATQADSVALESAALHGGLLTFALVHEGLGDGRHKPQAPLDERGAARLDSWLKYALDEVPRLETVQDAQTHGGLKQSGLAASVEPLFVPRDPPAPAPIQQPRLFDFTGQTSAVEIQPLGAR
jgi:WD40 repeat protein